MKTLVIYSSKTGFTKKYAEWICEELAGDAIPLKVAKTKSEEFFKMYDAIVFGSWVMASNIVDLKWFLEKSVELQNKKIAVFCVGASKADNANIVKMLETSLTTEQSDYIKLFYCPGGIDYSKMNFFARFVLKTMASGLSKKKDATSDEKAMAEALADSFDDSDREYAMDIVEYLK